MRSSGYLAVPQAVDKHRMVYAFCFLRLWCTSVCSSNKNSAASGVPCRGSQGNSIATAPMCISFSARKALTRFCFSASPRCSPTISSNITPRSSCLGNSRSDFVHNVWRICLYCPLLFNILKYVTLQRGTRLKEVVPLWKSKN